MLFPAQKRLSRSEISFLSFVPASLCHPRAVPSRSFPALRSLGEAVGEGGNAGTQVL